MRPRQPNADLLVIRWAEPHSREPRDAMAARAVAGIRKEDLENLNTIVDVSAVDEVVRWLCEALAVNDLAATITSSARAISELVDVVKSYSHMGPPPGARATPARQRIATTPSPRVRRIVRRMWIPT